jgi:uncharacterized repeat protein (TIGR03803 family)
MKTLIAYLLAALVGCGVALGQAQLTSIYSFAGTPDGQSPVGALVFDKAGNLYGTTEGGGVSGWGSVFELSPNGDGTWTESILYSFCEPGCPNGTNPAAALVPDDAGNLYGTTIGGGGPQCPPGYPGCGTVFELMHPATSGGMWTESVLYEFCQIPGDDNCIDGAQPHGKLTFDISGNLYGTVPLGGANGGGAVFELSPSSGGWTETLLYSFCPQPDGLICPDGDSPEAGVTFDKSGNLYGTTAFGGSNKYRGGGVVFKLSPGSNGWAENVLYGFLTPSGHYGGYLLGDVTLDSAGNVYSTGNEGGEYGQGVVFRLTPIGSLEELSFDADTNGYGPAAGVLIDPRSGAVYGTTTGGPYQQFPGTIFEVAGTTITVLAYTSEAVGALISDKTGQHLYGATKNGGDFQMGSVYVVGH